MKDKKGWLAGLLPILWSNRAGAEVMKLLAAPIIGGMVSSLHVPSDCDVNDFCLWLRERELKKQTEL